jgi:hypothetical protein
LIALQHAQSAESGLIRDVGGEAAPAAKLKDTCSCVGSGAGGGGEEVTAAAEREPAADRHAISRPPAKRVRWWKAQIADYSAIWLDDALSDGASALQSSTLPERIVISSAQAKAQAGLPLGTCSAWSLRLP